VQTTTLRDIMKDLPGRHFLQIPGPTNLPDRVLRAMDRPIPDHRCPEMPALLQEVTDGLKHVFQTRDGEILLFPGSARLPGRSPSSTPWNPGTGVLAFDIGQFSRWYPCI